MTSILFNIANERNCLRIQLSVCTDNLQQYFQVSLVKRQNDSLLALLQSTECLRDFEDSNVLKKIYLLFIFENRKGTRGKEWGGAVRKIGHFLRTSQLYDPK